MKKETPKTVEEVKNRMVEIETKRAEDYKWLLNEVLEHIEEIIREERIQMAQAFKMISYAAKR